MQLQNGFLAFLSFRLLPVCLHVWVPLLLCSWSVGNPSLCSGSSFFCMLPKKSCSCSWLHITWWWLATQTSRFQCSSTTLKSNGPQVLSRACFSSQGTSSADGSLFTHLAKLHTQELFSSFPLSSCCLNFSHAIIHHNLVIYHFIPSRMAVIRKPEITSFGWTNG